MNFNIHQAVIELGNGQQAIIETGKLARQADGAITLKCGNTMLLATVVAAKEPKEGIDFFPLTVDYQEKFAAAGRIPGSFHRREGRTTDYEILISRLVDRVIRPLFPKSFACETQVLISLISLDAEIEPDALVGLAASAALTISDIPFEGPISEVRVAKIGGEYLINPAASMMKNATLDIIVGATYENIMMVEGEAKECQEQELIEAIQIGHKAIQGHCNALNTLREACGKAKREVPVSEDDDALKERIRNFAKDLITQIAKSGSGKQERKAALKKIKEDLLATYSEEELESLNKALFDNYLAKLEKETIREMVLHDRVRLDGRKTDEIRPLYMEVDYLPAAHGSALFTRGETQSLTTVTLGSKDDEQLIDIAKAVEFRKFLLHYNFPPFCTGEVKPQRGPSRREVGHGNLALRSLKQMLPTESENPYTIRVVSDVLESNGSSSMATVCAGSLALMDSGISYKKHVSGIAMGMISEGDKYAILSDILGDEDHLGDMDFKVTGTVDGICGCQMDIKIDGLSYEVLSQALEQAKRGRLHILEAMHTCIPAAREDLKPHTPRAYSFEILKDFIGAVIGPGGKVIQGIQEKTNSTITIEEIKERGIGIVTIMAINKADMDAAVNEVKKIVTIPEVGEVYDAKVVSIMPYGAFVEFMPGKQGLLHISEISWKRLENMEGVLAEGDSVKVKLMDIDAKTGKFRLSAKTLLPKE
jgi:polyribonucleotide nucleotidyltransferase